MAIVPTYIDFEKKEIGAFDTVWPSCDYDADLKKIRSLYKARMAKHPENFIEAWNMQSRRSAKLVLLFLYIIIEKTSVLSQ